MTDVAKLGRKMAPHTGNIRRHPQEVGVQLAAHRGPHRTEACVGAIVGPRSGPLTEPAHALFARVEKKTVHWGTRRHLSKAQQYVALQCTIPLVGAIIT